MIFNLDKMTKLAAPFYAHFHDSPETMSFGFRVYACGSMPGEALRWWTAQDRSVRSRHSYVLQRALRGSARLKLSSRKEWIDLQAGHYWLVLPGEPVVYENVSHDWRHFLVAFEIHGHEERQDALSTAPRHGTLAADGSGQHIFEDFDTIARSGDPRRECLIPGLLHQALDGLFPRHPQPESGKLHSIIRSLAGRIRENPGMEWEFQAEARNAGISYSLLRQRFREQTGLPPRRFVIRERIQLASRYLLEGRSVGESGELCGIPDPYYFSRTFKQVTGRKPSDYHRGQVSASS